jgi:hypothetical protein
MLFGSTLPLRVSLSKFGILMKKTVGQENEEKKTHRILVLEKGGGSPFGLQFYAFRETIIILQYIFIFSLILHVFL